MKDKEKLLKESLSFSKLEASNVPREVMLYRKEDNMSKVAKLLLALSFIVAVLIGGVLVFYDQIAMILKTPEIVQKKEVVPIVKEPEKINAVVSMVIGEVKIRSAMDTKDAEIGYLLSQGDTIVTHEDSECEVQVNRKALVRVGENTKVSFSEIVAASKGKRDNILDLMEGTLRSAVKELGKDEFKVRTDTAVAAVRGTKFLVSVNDTGHTRVLVSEGRVVVGIRSKTVHEIASRITEPSDREEILKNESVGEIVVEKGKEVRVRPEDQKKVDEKIQKAVDTRKLEEKDVSLITKKLEKEVAKISKDVKLTKKNADRKEIALLDKTISKDILVTSPEMVKVKFVPESGVKDAKLFLNDAEISKLPVERILEAGKEYDVRVEINGKVLFSEKLRFSKDSKVVISEPKKEIKGTRVEESAKVEEMKPAEKLGEKVEPVEVSPKVEEEAVIAKEEKKGFATLDTGAKVVSGYGKWASYHENYIFVTPSGVGVFDGMNMKIVSVRGISYGFSGDTIAALSKNEDDHLVLKVANLKGEILANVNLGETTKGTIIVSRPAIIGKKVFVPSIDGIHIVDIRTADKKVAKIGSVYSDVAVVENEVVGINEVGEVYLVYSDGNFTKVAQLPLTTLRRATVTSDGEKVFVFSRGNLYIIGKGGETLSVNTGIKGDTLPIVYGDRVVLFAEKKITVVRKSGEVLYTITTMGTIQGTPYIGNGYIALTATDGTHVYDLRSGKHIATYEIPGNSAVIIDDKLYVISEDKTTIIPLK